MSSNRVKYQLLEDGKSKRLNLDKEDWMISCCDCGLVHLLEFNHVAGNVWDITVIRQPRRTGQKRRHMRKTSSAIPLILRINKPPRPRLRIKQGARLEEKIPLSQC